MSFVTLSGGGYHAGPPRVGGIGLVPCDSTVYNAWFTVDQAEVALAKPARIAMTYTVTQAGSGKRRQLMPGGAVTQAGYFMV